MTVETAIPEQARLASTFRPSAAVELRANGGTGALPLDRLRAGSATGDAVRGGPARAMDGLEVLR